MRDWWRKKSRPPTVDLGSDPALTLSGCSLLRGRKSPTPKFARVIQNIIFNPFPFPVSLNRAKIDPNLHLRMISRDLDIPVFVGRDFYLRKPRYSHEGMREMGNIWESGNSLWRKVTYIVDLPETLDGRGPLLGLYNRII
jgi:uncharacterized protein YceK